MKMHSLSNVLDIILLVLLRHLDIRSTRLELNRDEFAEPLFDGRKGFVNNICDVVFTTREK